MSGLVQTTPLTSQQILVLRFYESSAWKVSKYEVFFGGGAYFPVFSSSTGKYGPGKTHKVMIKNPYLDTFHAVLMSKTTVYSGLCCVLGTLNNNG